MIPDIGVNLSGDMLQDGGTRDIQNVPYRVYTSNNVSAGSKLSFDISGRAGTGDSGGLSWQMIALGAGGVGLVLLGVGVWLYQRNRSASPVPVDVPEILEEEIPASAEDAEALMDAIIALDDQYQAGELPEDAYRQRRAELKERLKNIQ
jgi:hypothetical protein